MILQITGDKKIEVSQENGEKIKELLLEIEPPKFIEIEGQAIKTANIIGVFKEDGVQSYTPAYMEYHWSDDKLTQWEQGIFEQHDTFKDYLISERVWVVNTKYPDGVVKNPNGYRLLIAKWNALQDLRYRREKASGFKGRQEWLKKLRSRTAQLAQTKSISEEPKEEINPKDIPF